MTFGERLTNLRKEYGYKSRNEFAVKLGIPSTTLRNYETNVREPGHTFLKQVSEFFNVSVGYLLCLTDEKEVLHTFRLRSSEQNMIEQYRSLDPHGKDMVDTVLEKEVERMAELEKEPTSTIIEIQPHLEVSAAHARTDIESTDEDQAHHDAIMNDDSEWE